MEIILGLVTGILIGLTGTGGGVLLTPLLLVLTSLPAVVIIGTGIVVGAVTKLVGVLEHRRLGQIQGRLALLLIGGSIPGVLGGVWVIQWLRTSYLESQIESFLKGLLAITLIAVAVLLPLIGSRRKGKVAGREGALVVRGREWQFVTAGATVGFLVTLTSVGSGSLMMAFLLLVVPLPIAKMVGTDILFGLVTLVVAGSMHLWMNNFDGLLFLKVTVGAVPGVIVGSRMTRWLPEVSFRWVFSVIYFSLGTRLLMG